MKIILEKTSFYIFGYLLEPGMGIWQKRNSSKIG
jgi:hypothetical protein